VDLLSFLSFRFTLVLDYYRGYVMFGCSGFAKESGPLWWWCLGFPFSPLKGEKERLSGLGWLGTLSVFRKPLQAG
jgi:hypothetical protein